MTKIIRPRLHKPWKSERLFDLMVSIPGVGPVIATELLLATNEMQSINEPKKLACHAGVAPFDGGARALPFGQQHTRQN